MVAVRPIRFGVVVPALQSAKQLTELVHSAEDLGYSAVWFVDHVTARPAPLIAAMAALADSTRLRVGTQLVAAPLHNPTLLAKEVTTLDVLSDGRFDFGIGAGWPRDSDFGASDFDQTGIDPGDAGTRLDRLIETVEVFRRFQSSTETWNYSGDLYQLRNLEPFPLSGPRRRTPLIIGGAGPRLLRFAARHADIINLAPRPPIVGRTTSGGQAFGRTMLDQLATIKMAAGDRYRQLRLAVMSTAGAAAITTDAATARDRLEDLAASLNTTVEAAAVMPATLIGSRSQIFDRVQEHRDRYDISYRTIPAALMRDFAPLLDDLLDR